MRLTLLSDVDGCVGGLMEAFVEWLYDEYRVEVSLHDITCHKISLSPELTHQNDVMKQFFGVTEKSSGGLQAALAFFLGLEDVYRERVKLIDGAKEAISVISDQADVVFVTANMRGVPESYVSKYRWLKEHFPSTPIITAPSDMKHLVHGTWAVDDRYDIVSRWNDVGTKAMLFSQPWSEAPVGAWRYNWERIATDVCDDVLYRKDVMENFKSGGHFGGEFG